MASLSRHACQVQLKLMLTLIMKPKYFIPIHSEYRMLYHHRLLVESVEVERGNTFVYY
jgi:ribonuclease J